MNIFGSFDFLIRNYFTLLIPAGFVTRRAVLVMREQRRRLLERGGSSDAGDHEGASSADRLQRGRVEFVQLL